MCQICKNENADDYEGDSIAAKRTQVLQSIIDRHPELGLNTGQVVYRFVPKAEERCVRVNLATDTPRYEIHAPRYGPVVMSDRPSLSDIALASTLESNGSFEDACDILGISSGTPYGAFFVGKEPPLNTARAERGQAVDQYERDIQIQLQDNS